MHPDQSLGVYDQSRRSMMALATRPVVVSASTAEDAGEFPEIGRDRGNPIRCVVCTDDCVRSKVPQKAEGEIRT
jgi:hypothetical protein